MAEKNDQANPHAQKETNWRASVAAARQAREQAKQMRKGKAPSLRRWATRRSRTGE